MLFHIFLSFLIWTHFFLCFSSSTTLPPIYSYPKLNLTSSINLAQNVDLQNPTSTVYTTMDATDFYVSRLTDKGKL
jgi:hypothetical protein